MRRVVAMAELPALSSACPKCPPKCLGREMGTLCSLPTGRPRWAGSEGNFCCPDGSEGRGAGAHVKGFLRSSSGLSGDD